MIQYIKQLFCNHKWLPKDEKDWYIYAMYRCPKCKKQKIVKLYKRAEMQKIILEEFRNTNTKIAHFSTGLGKTIKYENTKGN